MKRYRLLIVLLTLTTIISCGPSGNNGELVGVSTSSKKWFEPTPQGMSLIPRGFLKVGPSDEDPTGGLSTIKPVTIEAFWMDETEITNSEYRQFVFWVRDSIARQLLYNSANPNAQYYGIENEMGDFQGLNWDEDIDWADTMSLEELYIPLADRFNPRKREIDSRKLMFQYSWVDFKKAASRSNSYDYQTQSYNGNIENRSAFLIQSKKVNVYPDTLCWIRDYSYSYNDPRALRYFWHPGFDDYPVVGVTWDQANAFSKWRTKLMIAYLNQKGMAGIQDYRLPTEYEWEYAARGGTEATMYPWGGYYTTNSEGEFLANFKPQRGNYVADGGVTTVEVGTYPPNNFNLYDMAGNVAEWTRTAYEELATAMVNELNPDYTYNAKESDAPALKRKVVKGGSWKDISYYLQNSSRTFEYQDTTRSYIGFRCVRQSFSNDFN